LDRKQALVFLKMLSDSNIIDPSWVSIENQVKGYKLKIKEAQKNDALERFCANNNVKLESQNGYWLISKL